MSTVLLCPLGERFKISEVFQTADHESVLEFELNLGEMVHFQRNIVFAKGTVYTDLQQIFWTISVLLLPHIFLTFSTCT